MRITKCVQYQYLPMFFLKIHRNVKLKSMFPIFFLIFILYNTSKENLHNTVSYKRSLF